MAGLVLPRQDPVFQVTSVSYISPKIPGKNIRPRKYKKPKNMIRHPRRKYWLVDCLEEELDELTNLIPKLKYFDQMLINRFEGRSEILVRFTKSLTENRLVQSIKSYYAKVHESNIAEFKKRLVQQDTDIRLPGAGETT